MPSLIGRPVPRLDLMSTSGEWINLGVLPGFVVLFIYPYSGRPDVPDPAGWDDIPGAHGSTPQAIAYSKVYEDFQKQAVRVFGVSLQGVDWQREFAARCALIVPLLSDEEGRWSGALGLAAFEAGGRTFLKRTTLILRDGMVIAVRDPGIEPAKDALQTLALFRRP